MYRRILVPVDGSAPSDRALDSALGLAKATGAKVRLVHIVDPLPPVSIDGMYTDVDAFRDAVIASGQAALKRAQRRAARSARRVESALLEAVGRDISSAIVAEAKRWRADLIVLGTHGRTGLARLVLGSVAEGVVRQSTAPMLLVRARVGRRAKR